MTTRFRSRKFGTCPALVATAILTFAAMPGANAETVATINGVDIDSSFVDLYLESKTQRPASEAKASDRETALRELIDIYLLATQPSAAEVTRDPRVKAQLELQERGAIAQAVVREFLDNHQATDEEIAAEYASQSKLMPPKQFKARHILVESQAAAQGLIAELRDGADFAELAKAKSTDSAESGGDLGWFSPDRMAPPFAEAVAALEDGEFTLEPVQTQYGWHVILREDSRDNEPPPLDSVRDVIKQRVEQAKLQDYLQGLREEQTTGTQ
jgi:peptidyl-prolyl cis-trans isomerase C